VSARAVLVVTLIAAAAPRARADTHCRPIVFGTPALAQVDAAARLRFLQERMHHAAHRSRIWTFTWLSIYGALTIGNAVLTGVATNESDRIAAGIGTAASFVGVLSVALNPPKVLFDSPRLDRALAAVGPDTNLCAVVSDAERYLLRGAKQQAFGKSPLIHVGNFVFNAGIGMLLGAGFGRWKEAMIDSIVGIAIGEVQIISQPDDLVRDLTRYRLARFNGNSSPPPPPVTWRVAPIVGRGAFGLAAALSF
jgi:hypothetical protein